MIRNPTQLTQQTYDLLVIGGGIYGACVAWDAALRGLTVALVEKGDFGQATSANSLKIIHGGLRYLQDANLGLMRAMSRERAIWLRIAPHLVHPLPCLTPTYATLKRSKAAMAIALKFNDWLSFDRNRRGDPQKHLPAGQIISKTKCLELLPDLPAADITGGAIWYDAQMHNSERLLLSFVLGAAQQGATVANYVEVTGFIQSEDEVKGVQAVDRLTGRRLQIGAKLTINCAGVWINSLLAQLPRRPAKAAFQPSIAMNFVTRQLFSEYAVGLMSRPQPHQLGRMLFITPWGGYSLIGTYHTASNGTSEEHRPPEPAIQKFLAEINSAYPAAALTRSDINHVQWGFLPQEAKPAERPVSLVRESRIHDHEQEDGLAGLLTVVGVKYTTARKTAQQVVDLALKKLRRRDLPCQTDKTGLYGGAIKKFSQFRAQALAAYGTKLKAETISHLVYNYGSEYEQILAYVDEKPAWSRPLEDNSPVIGAEIIHAVRQEMAYNLSDVIRRRTPLGAVGLPSESCLRTCAGLMAAELGWDQAQREQALEEIYASYAATQPAAAKRRVYS